ncbi:MAG: pilus assembly protein PilM [Candidatus Saccharimonadales bacterium]
MKKHNNKDEYFGLDIGTTGVRLVQLKSGDDNPSLVTYGQKAFDKVVDVASMTNEQDREIVKTKIDELKKELKVSTNRAVVAVPDKYSLASVVRVPLSNREEMSKFIYDNAEKYFDRPINGLRIDWYIVSPDTNQAEVDVLVVGANESVISKYVDLINYLELELVALEIDTLALARSVVTNEDSAVVALDLGYNNASMSVVFKRLPREVASVNMGGEVFINMVAQSFNVDRDEGQKFVEEFGVSLDKFDGQVLKAIEPGLVEIIDKISQVSSDFTAKNKTKIAKVVLLGGTAAMPSLASYLSENLKTPVEIANPWKNVAYPANQHDALMNLSLNFGIAVGLAQRGYI